MTFFPASSFHVILFKCVPVIKKILCHKFSALKNFFKADSNHSPLSPLQAVNLQLSSRLSINLHPSCKQFISPLLTQRSSSTTPACGHIHPSPIFHPSSLELSSSTPAGSPTHHSPGVHPSPPLAIKLNPPHPAVILHPCWGSNSPLPAQQFHPCWRSNSPLSTQQSLSTPARGQTHPLCPADIIHPRLAVKVTPLHPAVIIHTCWWLTSPNLTRSHPAVIFHPSC